MKLFFVLFNMSMYSAFSLPDHVNLEGMEIDAFHGFVLSTLAFISSVVFFFGYVVFHKKNSLHSNIYGSSWLETVWSVTPIFVLLVLTLPSISLLYMIEGIYTPLLTVKATRHQWYWNYETRDYNEFEYDSYIVPESKLVKGDLRILEVDNSLCLPYGTDIKILTTANDVIHSWALPALGLKSDAVPGRLNSINIHSIKSGSYYGQCSEICGIYHSFMPIHVEFVNWDSFLNVTW